MAYAKMNDGNLAAVDRVVTIVRELDRYHGFAPDRAGARGARFERSVPAAGARGALAIPGGGRNPRGGGKGARKGLKK